MAVLKVKFDNVLCFDGFEADFTYKKKLVKTSLEHEYLENYPNMRYRTLNIIVGSNATGKTSLGKVIWKVFLFIYKKEADIIKGLVSEPNKDAYILMDCVFSEGLFFRIEIKVLKDGDILVKYQEVELQSDDTYETVVGRLNYNDGQYRNYLQELQDVAQGGWIFKFPTIESGSDIIACEYEPDERKEFAKILFNVLKAFDPSIVKTVPSNEIANSYIVTFKNGTKAQITDGEKLSDIKALSSGSKYAVNIAGIMYAIKKHKNGFYFVDEQFSYVNPDLEIACLVTMVNMLDDGEQLFFTSHNTEILSLPFPNHSFNFLKKTNVGDNTEIRLINAASLEKRNNVNIKNLYDNDYFDVAPDTSLIMEIGANK